MRQDFFSRSTKLTLFCLFLVPTLVYSLDKSYIEGLLRLRSSGEYSKLIETINKDDPYLTNPESLSLLSDVLVLNFNYDSEKKSFQKDSTLVALDRLLLAHDEILKTSPAFGKIYLSKANILYAVIQNRLLPTSVHQLYSKEAIDNYEKALLTGVQAKGIRERLGLLVLDSGDANRAATYFIAALKENPSSPSLLYNTSYTLFILENYAEALKYLQQFDLALLDESTRKNALLLKAELLLGLKQYSEAAKSFELIQKADPKNLYPLRKRIEAEFLSGELSTALGLTRQYLEFTPGDIDALQRLYNSIYKLEGNNDIIQLLRELAGKYARNRPEVSASLAWLESMLQLAKKDTQAALESLANGKKYLLDTDGYNSINTALKELETQIKLR